MGDRAMLCNAMVFFASLISTNASGLAHTAAQACSPALPLEMLLSMAAESQSAGPGAVARWEEDEASAALPAGSASGGPWGPTPQQSTSMVVGLLAVCCCIPVGRCKRLLHRAWLLRRPPCAVAEDGCARQYSIAETTRLGAGAAE
jgi:hypothetical protein